MKDGIVKYHSKTHGRSTIQRMIDLTFYSPDGCHYWIGSAPIGHGYGITRIAGKNVLVTHFIYRHFKGDIPKGMLVCHTCDNKRCINPDHLFLGTYQDNVDDMHRKGRARKALGTENGQSKLKPEQVKEIKLSWRNPLDTKTLAVKFNVKYMTIHGIIKGKTWRHIIV